MTTSQTGVKYPYKLTITIIELHHHVDALHNILNILSEDETIKLILLVSERVYQDAKLKDSNKPNIEVFVKSKKERLKTFLASQQKNFDQSDIVYINTIKNNFRDLCRHNFNQPLIIRIHNAHADLDPWHHLDWSKQYFFNTLRYVLWRLMIQRRQLHKNCLLRSASGLMFANSVITQYVQQNKFNHYQKTLPPSLPLCFLDDHIRSAKNKPENEPVIMAITGNIDSRRKDYIQVYEALSNVAKLFERPVELKLLGKPKGDEGKKIVGKFLTIESERLKISYNTRFIPQEEYLGMIKGVDFLIAPIKVDTKYRVFREIYGKSKMSGIENDVIANQKPAILIDSYTIPDELKSVCEAYHTTEELGQLLVNWVNQLGFLEYLSCFETLDAYKAETIRCNFINLCEKIKS